MFLQLRLSNPQIGPVIGVPMGMLKVGLPLTALSTTWLNCHRMANNTTASTASGTMTS